MTRVAVGLDTGLTCASVLEVSSRLVLLVDVARFVEILALSLFLVRYTTMYWHGSSACLMQDLKNGKSTGLAKGSNFDLSLVGLYF